MPTEALITIRDKYKKLHDEKLLLPEEAERLVYELSTKQGTSMGSLNAAIINSVIDQFAEVHDLDELDWRRLKMHQANAEKTAESRCAEGGNYCVGMVLLENRIALNEMINDLNAKHPISEKWKAKQAAKEAEKQELAKKEAQDKLEVKKRSEETADKNKAAEEHYWMSRRETGLREEIEAEHRAALELQDAKSTEAGRVKKAEEEGLTKDQANLSDGDAQPEDIDSNISVLDSRLNGTWKMLRSKMSKDEFEVLRKAQLRWIHDRDSCGSDKACIQRKYIERIKFLDALK